MSRKRRRKRKNKSLLDEVLESLESFLERLGTVGIVIFLFSIGLIIIILWLALVNPFSIPK